MGFQLPTYQLTGLPDFFHLCLVGLASLPGFPVAFPKGLGKPGSRDPKKKWKNPQVVMKKPNYTNTLYRFRWFSTIVLLLNLIHFQDVICRNALACQSKLNASSSFIIFRRGFLLWHQSRFFGLLYSSLGQPHDGSSSFLLRWGFWFRCEKFIMSFAGGHTIYMYIYI